MFTFPGAFAGTFGNSFSSPEQVVQAGDCSVCWLFPAFDHAGLHSSCPPFCSDISAKWDESRSLWGLFFQVAVVMHRAIWCKSRQMCFLFAQQLLTEPFGKWDKRKAFGDTDTHTYPLHGQEDLGDLLPVFFVGIHMPVCIYMYACVCVFIRISFWPRCSAKMTRKGNRGIVHNLKKKKKEMVKI